MERGEQYVMITGISMTPAYFAASSASLMPKLLIKAIQLLTELGKYG